MDIPENLESLDLEGLKSLREQVRARLAELKTEIAEQGSPATADQADELEALADIAVAAKNRGDAVKAEADAEADRKARADAATEAADAALAEPEAETPAETEAAAEPETAAEPAGEPVLAAATVTPSAAALTAAQAAEDKPTPSGGGTLLAEAPAMRATGYAARIDPGTVFADLGAVGKTVSETLNSLKPSPTGMTEYLPIATGQKVMGGFEVGGDEKANFSILDRIRQDAETENYEALVASGPFCTPQTPLYDYFRLAVAQSPVERSLATVQAPRGGIRYIIPPDTTAAVNAGIGFTDEADIDPADEDTWKPCTRVICPTLADEYVTALSQCVTFGNLQYKTFPEQTAAFLEDLAVAFASRKEVYFLDYIDGHSTAVSGVDTGFGAWRQHLYNLTLASVGYRKRRGMVRGSRLRCYEPDWLLDLIKLDMALDHDQGLQAVNVPDSQVEDLYTSRGLEVIWYNDSATGRGQKFAEAQTAGEINVFPTVVQTYIHSPGTFVKLDAGALDVGLVRDTTTNRTNDVQLFMEEWLGMAMLGLEAIRLIDTVLATGAATGTAPVYTG